MNKPRLVSYYEQNELQRIPEIINALKNGLSVALVSDAGTPTISDPGFKLVRECVREGIRVESIPGPSSVISSLVSSGLILRASVRSVVNQRRFAGSFLPPIRVSGLPRLASRQITGQHASSSPWQSHRTRSNFSGVSTAGSSKNSTISPWPGGWLKPSDNFKATLGALPTH